MLVLRWQRLVDEEGRTCPHCGNTEEGSLFIHHKFKSLFDGFTRKGRYVFNPYHFNITLSRILNHLNSLFNGLPFSGNIKFRAIDNISTFFCRDNLCCNLNPSHRDIISQRRHYA